MRDLNRYCFNNCCKCLLRDIGATVMGVKPAELRSVPLYNDQHSYWKQCKETILNYDEIRIIEIKKVNNRMKAFFYHATALDEQLSKPNNLKFLREIGYPREYNLNKYINHLKNRLAGDGFPHEIGIFFGYPLKDVLGFMGYIDLEVTQAGEWKFYGNKSISLLQQKRFERARKIFNTKLNKIKDVSKFYKVV